MKPICFFLLLNILLLSSCAYKKSDNDSVKIIMPSDTQIYSSAGTDTSRRFLTEHSQFKIYTLINTSCSSCLLKLEGWDRFRSENPEMSKVPIIPVCYSRDNFELLKFLFQSHKIPNIHMPLVLDLKDSFARLNNSVVRSGDFTALTDGEDRIVVPGDPLTNNNVKNRFLKAVRNAD